MCASTSVDAGVLTAGGHWGTVITSSEYSVVAYPSMSCPAAPIHSRVRLSQSPLAL